MSTESSFDNNVNLNYRCDSSACVTTKEFIDESGKGLVKIYDTKAPDTSVTVPLSEAQAYLATLKRGEPAERPLVTATSDETYKLVEDGESQQTSLGVPAANLDALREFTRAGGFDPLINSPEAVPERVITVGTLGNVALNPAVLSHA